MSPAPGPRADAAQAKADRYRPLAEIEAVSKQDYTDAAAQARAGRAPASRRPARRCETAQINLRFTTSRRRSAAASAARCSPSARWSPSSQADPLAMIQRLDPIYVDIQQSSADLLTLRRALAAGGVDPGQHAGPPQARGRQRLRLHRHGRSSPRRSSIRAPAR